MKDRSEENLKELFGRFLGVEQADETVEDIKQTDRILSEYPAPEPDQERISDIKSTIAKILVRKHAKPHRMIARKWAALAAVFVILTMVGVRVSNKDSGQIAHISMLPEAVWESDDLISDDPELSSFASQIDQIEDQFRGVQWDENGSNGEIVFEELEMELMEINSNFWKG